MSVAEGNPVRAAAPGGLGRPVMVDPLSYTGWDTALSAHSGASFFHGAAWARVLHETYGHRPAYFCRFANERLEELLAVMEVSSPCTGRRGVSLPFTDFCPWLTDSSLGPNGDAPRLQDAAVEHGRTRDWRYLECRGPGTGWPGGTPSLSFLGHCVDLRPGEEALFAGLDSAFRRGIRKGGRLAIRVEFDNDLASIKRFFGMHCLTRRRHGLPPQPFRFFENIARYVLEAGQGVVGTAWAGESPVAAAVFFHRGKEVIYKYGASDYAFQNLRPNNVLMWEAMRRFCSQGYERLHLGRTSLGEEGLRRFKLGFGAREEPIDYYSYNLREKTFLVDKDGTEGWFNQVFRRMPLPLLRFAGAILYPHLS